jgi:O-antigen/teichoic acid export membrane protein
MGYVRSKINLLVSIASLLIISISSFLIIPILINRFGIIDWSLYSLFVLYVGVFLFIENSIITYVSLNIVSRKTNEFIYEPFCDKNLVLLLFSIIIIGVLVISFYFYELDYQNTYYEILIFVILNIFVRSFTAIFKGVLFANPNQLNYHLLNTIFQSTRPLILLILTMFFLQNIFLILFVYIIFSIAELFIYSLLYIRKHKFTKTLISNDKNEYYIFQLLVSGAIATIAINFDKILAFSSGGILKAGEYTIATTIVSLLLIFVSSASSSYSLKFRELFISNQLNLVDQYFFSLSKTNNILLLLAITIIIFNFPYLNEETGLNLPINNTVFMTLLLAGLISSNMWIPGSISTAFNKNNFNILSNISHLLIYSIVFYILLDLKINEIFSTSLLITVFINTLIFIIFFKKYVHKFSLKSYFINCLVKPLAISSLILFPMFFLNIGGYMLVSLIYSIGAFSLFASYAYYKMLV